MHIGMLFNLYVHYNTRLIQIVGQSRRGTDFFYNGVKNN